MLRLEPDELVGHAPRADLGEVVLDGALDAVTRPVVDSVTYANPVLGVLPLHSAAWLGRPGRLVGHA